MGDSDDDAGNTATGMTSTQNKKDSISRKRFVLDKIRESEPGLTSRELEQSLQDRFPNRWSALTRLLNNDLNELKALELIRYDKSDGRYKRPGPSPAPEFEDRDAFEVALHHSQSLLRQLDKSILDDEEEDADIDFLNPPKTPPDEWEEALLNYGPLLLEIIKRPKNDCLIQHLESDYPELLSSVNKLGAYMEAHPGFEDRLFDAPKAAEKEPYALFLKSSSELGKIVLSVKLDSPLHGTCTECPRLRSAKTRSGPQ